MTHNGLGSLTSLELSRRGLLGLGAAVGVGAAVSACGGGSSGTPGAAGKKIAEGAYDGPAVELSFWNGFTGGDGPFMKGMVEKFNGENENIKVKMNSLDWGDFYSKMPNAVASGAGPDIAAMHIDQVATNAARGVIQPLDNMTEALELEEGDFNELIWKAGVYEDKRYGIPLDIHPLGFFYNKALLKQAGMEEPPQDRESWEAALKALKGAGVDKPFWASATWPAHLCFISLLKQFGGSLYDDEGEKATFNSEAGVEALTWWVSHVPEYSPPNVTQDADYTAFKQGKNALHWNGIWTMNDWAKVEGLEWGAAPVPQIGSEPGVWASSHQLTVMRQSKPDDNKLHAAREFLGYLSKNSGEWAKSGQIPARNTVRESGEFGGLEVQSTLAEQLDHVVFPLAVAGIGDVTSPTFEVAVNEVVLGKAKPKQALDAAAKKADQLLADNKKKYTA
jgi:multiple sugar transport system substrate-binding protein